MNCPHCKSPAFTQVQDDAYGCEACGEYMAAWRVHHMVAVANLKAELSKPIVAALITLNAFLEYIIMSIRSYHRAERAYRNPKGAVPPRPLQEPHQSVEESYE